MVGTVEGGDGVCRASRPALRMLEGGAADQPSSASCSDPPTYTLDIVAEPGQTMLGRALDAMGEATFLTGGDGRLHYANRSALLMLDAKHALVLRHGRVEAADPASRFPLAQMIAAASARAETGALSLSTQSGGRINVTMTPADGSGVVLVLAQPVNREDGHIVGQLMHAFRLTRAEADVARAIGAGASPAEIALARGASLSTVQSQFKTVASKLGCRRQSEIAAIVQAMPRLR